MAATSKKTLSHRQIALIHVAKAQLGLSDEQYRDLLLRVAGVTSSKALDPVGFHVVMEVFHELGFESDARRRNFGDRPGMASPAQVAFIRDLWSEYTDGQGNDLSLGKWLWRTFKVSHLRFLTAKQAPKAIGALRAMTAPNR